MNIEFMTQSLNQNVSSGNWIMIPIIGLCIGLIVYIVYQLYGIIKTLYERLKSLIKNEIEEKLNNVSNKKST